MSWSSRQLINQKDLVSLQKDLLAMYTSLLKEGYNTMGIMKNISDMTLAITLNNLKQEKDGFSNLILTNGLNTKESEMN